jgi:hypothetical protein
MTTILCLPLEQLSSSGAAQARAGTLSLPIHLKFYAGPSHPTPNEAPRPRTEDNPSNGFLSSCLLDGTGGRDELVRRQVGGEEEESTRLFLFFHRFDYSTMAYIR